MAATATIPPTETDADQFSLLLSKNAWHSSAPGKLRRAANSGDLTTLWKAWKKYLANRQVKPLRDLCDGKKSPLAWTLASQPDTQTNELLNVLDRAAAGRRKATEEASEQLAAWLAENEGAAVDRSIALQCLAWCHALPRLASATEPTLWCELFERFLTLVDDSVAIGSDADPAVVQLLRGELPLTLAYLFPELTATRTLGKPAATFLSTSITEMLDGDGNLHARYLDAARALFACWTRCRAMGTESKSVRFNKDAAEQYAWLITSAIRHTRHDGTQVLCDAEFGLWSAAMFNTALELDGDEADEEIADVGLPGRTGNYEPEEKWPECSVESEWADFATLRSEWARSGNHISVAYDQLPLQCELNVGKQTIFSTAWEFEIEMDGKILTPAADATWDQVCWESDADCDYLELELDFAEGVKLQRSFLLARDDQFLVMSDAVLGTFGRQLNYRSRLPLRSNVVVKESKKHSELAIGVREPTLRVLPLGLSEWRSDSHHGSLKYVDGALELSQSLSGSSVSAPLFIDLSRHRRKAPITWRQLTVGEERQIVPEDVAVGYRVEIGKAQWLFYRSLAPSSNRTVLGQNLTSEIMVCRFHRDGSVEQLLEVE